ncbi:hypothetical protein C8Q79DRAFT_47825 [Trametes meyenii]|nr:hypothetical protein C8Q79DRAFT_47825 [Trametes meyenii]
MANVRNVGLGLGLGTRFGLWTEEAQVRRQPPNHCTLFRTRQAALDLSLSDPARLVRPSHSTDHAIQFSLSSAVICRGIPCAIAPCLHCSRSQNRLSQDRYRLPFPLCCVSAVWDQIIALASAAATRYPSAHVLAAAALRAANGPGLEAGGHAQGNDGTGARLAVRLRDGSEMGTIACDVPRAAANSLHPRTRVESLRRCHCPWTPVRPRRTHKKSARALNSAHTSRYRASRCWVRPARHRGNLKSVAILPLTRSALCFPDRSSGHRKYALTPSCRPPPGTSGASGINANTPGRRLGTFAP